MDTSRWQEFALKEIFPKMERGKRLVQYNREPGDIPLATAGYQNEGVSDFISNQEQKRYCNKITIDMFCNVFYRDYTFCCDDNIIVLINDELSENVCLFLTAVISKDKFKFPYGRQYRKRNYETHMIKLPVKENHVPDWEYMETFIEEIKSSEKERAKMLLRFENQVNN